MGLTYGHNASRRDERFRNDLCENLAQILPAGRQSPSNHATEKGCASTRKGLSLLCCGVEHGVCE